PTTRWCRSCAAPTSFEESSVCPRRNASRQTRATRSWRKRRRFEWSVCPSGTGARAARLGLARTNRKLDRVAFWKRDRHVTVLGLADVIEIRLQRVGEQMDVVGCDERAWRELRLELLQQRQVEILPAVEKQHRHVGVEILQRLERIADAQIDDVQQPRLADVFARAVRLALQ